jgi:hypothetical protein
VINETALFGQVDVQVAFSSGVWTTVIPESTGLSMRRGGTRAGLGVKTDVGICTFTLLNAQDPVSGGMLRPGQDVRVIAPTALTPIFTGKIVDIAAAYPLDKATGVSRSVVQVTVADAVRIHATTPRFGAVINTPFFETFEARIARLALSAQAPIEVPAISPDVERYAL